MKKNLAYYAAAATLVLSTAAHAVGPGDNKPVDIGITVGLCDSFEHWRSPPHGPAMPYWRPCIRI